MGTDENKGVLKPDGDVDSYKLADDADHVWLTVRNISVYVRVTDEGVVCDLYAHKHEDEEAIASTYAFFDEVDKGEDCTCTDCKEALYSKERDAQAK